MSDKNNFSEHECTPELEHQTKNLYGAGGQTMTFCMKTMTFVQYRSIDGDL